MKYHVELDIKNKYVKNIKDCWKANPFKNSALENAVWQYWMKTTFLLKKVLTITSQFVNIVPNSITVINSESWLYIN